MYPSIESLIEKSIRYPEDLSPGELEFVEQAIEDDPACRMLRDFYETVYNELDRMPTQPSSQLEMFIASIFSTPHVIPLFPLNNSDLSNANLSVLIPGIGAEGEQMILTPLSTLGSRNARFVAVFLNNISDREKWRLKVYASEEIDRSNVLVGIPEINVDIFVPSGSADFRLPIEGEPDDRLASAIIRIPIWHVRMTEGRLVGDLPEVERGGIGLPSGHVLRVRQEDGLLVMEFDASEATELTTIRRVTVTDTEEKTHVLCVSSGYGHLTVETTSTSYDVRFYE